MERTAPKQKEPASFGIGPDGVKIHAIRSAIIQSDIAKRSKNMVNDAIHCGAATLITSISAYSIKLAHNTNSKVLVGSIAFAAAVDAASMFCLMRKEQKEKISLEQDLQDYLRKG
jgi:hypothetical protein